MSSAQQPVQAGLYTKLTSDGTLMGLIQGVFDAVPNDQAYPYVTLGEIEADEWSTFARLGQSMVVTLHTWSQGKGKKDAQVIQSRIDTLLHRGTITVSGFTFVSCIREFETVLQDPERGETWHGVQRFRVHVHA